MRFIKDIQHMVKDGYSLTGEKQFFLLSDVGSFFGSFEREVCLKNRPAAPKSLYFFIHFGNKRRGRVLRIFSFLLLILFLKKNNSWSVGKHCYHDKDRARPYNIVSMSFT
jgi:hypothetical protein